MHTRLRGPLVALIMLLASPWFHTPARGEDKEKPMTERRLLVGTDSGLWQVHGDPRTKQPWKQRALLERPKQSVRCVQRAHDGSLLVGFGMRGAGLYRSADAGRTWTPVKGWPKERQAWSVHAFSNGRLWVGGEPAAIWQGTVGKERWVENPTLAEIPERSKWTFIRPPYHAHVLGFSAHPRDAKRWLAAIEQGGVLETKDGGKTWRQISPFWDVHVALYADRDKLVAATNAGLMLRRPKQGWSKTPVVLGYATGLCRDKKGALFAALRGAKHALWKSRDGGATWQALPCEVAEPGHGVHALAPDPRQPNCVFHGAGDTIWRVEQGRAQVVARGLPNIRRVVVETVGRKE